MKISGWFRRNNTLMAQAKDAYRQLQEAWDEKDGWKEGYYEKNNDFEYIVNQLHRVARERDEERRLRLEAEDMLLDSYLRIHERDNKEE